MLPLLLLLPLLYLQPFPLNLLLLEQCSHLQQPQQQHVCCQLLVPHNPRRHAS
jgi:hypothetical protein